MLSKRKMPKISEVARLRLGMQGSAPDMVLRRNFLERKIGKSLPEHRVRDKIPIPANLEHVPIEFALKRTLMSLTSFHGIIGKEKWTNVKRIIETLHKGGKFRFKVIRKQERTKSELTRDGKKRRFHIKALPKKRKLKEKKKEAEKSLGLPTFKIIGVVNFRGAIQEIDSVLGKTKGREFRRLFKKYLFEEAEHTHWYLTETSEHLVMDQKEKAILEK